MYQQLIDQFIQQESLPATYREDIDRWFLPLATELEQRCQQASRRPLLLGINGAQGTGKSTLANLLATLLQANGLKVVSLSIDDFYLGKQQRQQLAASVHPLLATRGVPGTHDTALLVTLITQLQQIIGTTQLTLPVFDKASDDRVPDTHCPTVTGPVDLIILEGWFVGLKPQAESALATPVNALEREHDTDGHWRRYVNEKLAGTYQQVFDELDYLVMLKAPGFDQVRQWRNLQEAKLRNKTHGSTSGIMNAAQIDQFIQYFERLTRHCLTSLPAQADIVLDLDADHRVTHRHDRTAPH